jgi:hypothetical protein
VIAARADRGVGSEEKLIPLQLIWGSGPLGDAKAEAAASPGSATVSDSQSMIEIKVILCDCFLSGLHIHRMINIALVSFTTGLSIYIVHFLVRLCRNEVIIISRAHSFPQAAEFRAEPRNLPSAAEFTHFRGISRKMPK